MQNNFVDKVLTKWYTILLEVMKMKSGIGCINGLYYKLVKDKLGNQQACDSQFAHTFTIQSIHYFFDNANNLSNLFSLYDLTCNRKRLGR